MRGISAVVVHGSVFGYGFRVRVYGRGQFIVKCTGISGAVVRVSVVRFVAHSYEYATNHKHNRTRGRTIVRTPALLTSWLAISL